MRPLPAHSLAAAVALAFFVFAKSLLMRNARSKTLLFFFPLTRSESDSYAERSHHFIT